jgi:hypothetical protein
MRCQGSIEGIVAVSIALLFVTFVILPFMARSVNQSKIDTARQAGVVCDRIYSTLSSTLSSRKDFYQLVELPPTVGSQPYEIDFFPAQREAIINYSSGHILCGLPTTRVINSTNSSDPFVVTSNSLKFMNVDVTVMVDEL